MAGLAAAEGNARAPSRPAALYGRRAGQSARRARALSRLHALPHPWLERALDHRHAGLVRLHPHAQRGRDRSLRAREGRHQGGGDLNLVYSGPPAGKCPAGATARSADRSGERDHVAHRAGHRPLAQSLLAGGRVDRLVEPPRHAFELRVLLDGQRFIEDLAIDHRRALQADAVGAQSALEEALNDGFLRDDIALDSGAFADDELRGVDITDNAAKDLHGAGAYDIAGDQHAMPESGNGFRGTVVRRGRIESDVAIDAVEALVALAFRWGKIAQVVLPPAPMGRCPLLPALQRYN